MARVARGEGKGEEEVVEGRGGGEGRESRGRRDGEDRSNAQVPRDIHFHFIFLSEMEKERNRKKKKRATCALEGGEREAGQEGGVRKNFGHSPEAVDRGRLLYPVRASWNSQYSRLHERDNEENEHGVRIHRQDQARASHSCDCCISKEIMSNTRGKE